MIPGQEYTVNVALHRKGYDEEGNVIDLGIVKDKYGNDISLTRDFTTETSCGAMPITFFCELDRKVKNEKFKCVVDINKKLK